MVFGKKNEGEMRVKPAVAVGNHKITRTIAAYEIDNEGLQICVESEDESGIVNVAKVCAMLTTLIAGALRDISPDVRNRLINAIAKKAIEDSDCEDDDVDDSVLDRIEKLIDKLEKMNKGGER